MNSSRLLRTVKPLIDPPITDAALAAALDRAKRLVREGELRQLSEEGEEVRTVS